MVSCDEAGSDDAIEEMIQRLREMERSLQERAIQHDWAAQERWSQFMDMMYGVPRPSEIADLSHLPPLTAGETVTVERSFRIP